MVDLDLHYENPQHKYHFKAFLKKCPTSSKDATFTLIDVNPEDRLVDLQHPEKNWCQMEQVSLFR